MESLQWLRNVDENTYYEYNSISELQGNVLPQSEKSNHKLQYWNVSYFEKLHLKTFQFRRRAFGIEVHSLLEVPCCFGKINLLSVSSILMFLIVDNSTCSLSLTFFVTLNNFQILFLEFKPNE